MAKKRSSKKSSIDPMVAIGVLAAVGIGYYLYSQNKNSNNTDDTSDQGTDAPAASQAAPAQNTQASLSNYLQAGQDIYSAYTDNSGDGSDSMSGPGWRQRRQYGY